MGPMLAPWTLQSGEASICNLLHLCIFTCIWLDVNVYDWTMNSKLRSHFICHRKWGKLYMISLAWNMIDYITKGERDKYDDAQNAVQLHHNHSILVNFFSKQHLTRLPYWPFTCCICATYEYNTSNMERDIERQRHVGRTRRTRRQTGGRSETILPPPPPCCAWVWIYIPIYLKNI